MTLPVYLRKVTHGDRDEFLALVDSSRSLHEPWIHPPTTQRMYRHYVDRLERDDHVGLLVVERSSERIAGVINLNNIVRGSFLSASLGYYVGADFAGRGYMRSGLTQVVDHAFRALGLHRLEANIQPDNARSLALVRRCGFRHEGFSPAYLYIDGQWRDHERWAIVDARPGLT
jgi:ribosomal-protein-alanine N-acetyltransferase